MTEISKRLDQIIRKELSKNIIPIKTEKGILVGSILIVSNGSFKTLEKNGEKLYENINLNKAAIAISNLLAFNNNSQLPDQIFNADKEYGKWFLDSQLLRSNYEKAMKNRDFDRADMLWARYQESKNKTLIAKKKVEKLINI